MAKKEQTGTQKAAQIGPRKLKNLLNSARSAYRESRKLSGALGEQMRNAIEHDHLHGKAFRSVMAEDRMEPSELADFYAAQEYYRDELGLNERAESAPRLPMSGEAAANDDEDDERVEAAE